MKWPCFTTARPAPAETPTGAPGSIATVPHETPTKRSAMLLPPLIFLGIGGILSGLMTWFNVGFAPDFYWRWLTSFVSAVPVLALGFALMNVFDKLLQRVMASASNTLRTLAMAVLMALTLELLMSSVVTLRNVGWAEGFAAAWFMAFLRSLPVGMGIGLLMGFVVRPRLQRMLAGSTGA